MKTLFVIVLVLGASWFFWKKHVDGPPQVIENPVYGEVRVSVTEGNREVEAALFVRASSELDCKGRGLVGWTGAFSGCPSCKLTPPRCSAELPARYARLFDDVRIPSAYLSATAGKASERDGRLVVYGLTDQEGVMFCEMMKAKLAEKYTGTLSCIAPSGG
jgi:hypothetical protein